MTELAVSAIGADRPGIVAAVTHVLAARGGNVEDSAMTILGGQFAMMLLVETDAGVDALRAELEDATAELGLTLTVSEVDTSAPRSPSPTHVLSVYGSDRPGLLAGVTAALAETKANVTDLTTRLIGGTREPIYAMVVEFHTTDDASVRSAVQATCEELGVDHTLRVLDVETY